MNFWTIIGLLEQCAKHLVCIDVSYLIFSFAADFQIMNISVELELLFLIHIVKSEKLLLLTGTTKNGLSKHVEVIDLENSYNKCKMKSGQKLDFWNSVFSATGGLLNGDLPIICGGIQGKSTCHGIGNPSLMTSLKEERSFSASVLLENDSELWITGGYNNDIPSDTTEIVFSILDSIFSIPGPKLPIPLYGHCLVKINEESFMVIGNVTDAI